MHKPMKYNGYSVTASEQRCTCYVAGCLNDHEPRQQARPKVDVTEVVGAARNPRAARQIVALLRAADALRGIMEHGDDLWRVRGREIVADLERLGIYDDPLTT